MSIVKYIYIIIITFSMFSCQNVNVKSTERGVLFKRFAGGVDTSSFLNPGNHIISNWDRVIIYDIQIIEDEFQYVNESINMSIQYKIVLEEDRLALYHRSIGGFPGTYAERAIREHLESMSTKEIKEYLVGSPALYFDRFEQAIDKYYIKLIELKLNTI